MVLCAHQSSDNNNNQFLLKKIEKLQGEKLQAKVLKLFFMNGGLCLKKDNRNILKDGNNTMQIEDRLKVGKTENVVFSRKKKHCK